MSLWIALIVYLDNRNTEIGEVLHSEEWRGKGGGLLLKNYWCPVKLWRDADLKGQQANSPGQRPG